MTSQAEIDFAHALTDKPFRLSKINASSPASQSASFV